jgi:hypothetical protein
LGHGIAIALQQMHQLTLLAHQAIAQQSDDGIAAIGLLGVGEHGRPAA